MTTEVTVVAPAPAAPETPTVAPVASVQDVVAVVEAVKEITAPDAQNLVEITRLQGEVANLNGLLLAANSRVMELTEEVSILKALQVVDEIAEDVEEENEDESSESTLITEEIPAVLDVQEAVPEMVEKRETRKRYFL